MKIVFTLIVLLNFCLISLLGYSLNENQDRRTQVPSKIATNSVSQDTLSQNTIHINGKENVVSINNTKITANKGKITSTNNTTTHTIDINGEANAVNINQKGQGGSVNINQNGNGNQVNVTQSKTPE